MALTLEDVLAAPQDPELLRQHLQSIGAVPPPAPPPAPATIPAMDPAAAPAPTPEVPKDFAAPTHFDKAHTGPGAIELSPGARPEIPKIGPINAGPAPDLAGAPSPGQSATAGADEGFATQGTPTTPLPSLDYKGEQKLPTTSPGVGFGTQEYWRNIGERAEQQQQHPLGTPGNRDTTGGRILHVLGKIGNIAGEALIPNIMAAIPGTELHRGLVKETAAQQLGEQQTRDVAAQRAASEGELQHAQAANLTSETAKREAEDKQELVQDAQGNVTGWKDNSGTLHGINDADTPDAIKNIANDTENKRRPTFEKSANGDIVALSTAPDGTTSSKVVYHGDPKTVTETKIIMVGGKPHEVIFDATPNSPNLGKRLADLGETMVPAAQTAAGQKWVYGTDAQGRKHLVSADEAKANGYTQVRQAADSDYEKAGQHTAVLNDMQTKLNDVVASRKALDQNPLQRGIILKSLSHGDVHTMGDLVNLGLLTGATPETQEYIQSVLSLRESALALPKELTNGSRVSEIQASALWATLPGGASLNSSYALNQSKKFQGNIDRLRERVPDVGMTTSEEHPDLVTRSAHDHAPPPGKAPVYDKDGHPHFVDADKVNAFLADPQYKGWSKDAPRPTSKP